MRKENLLPWAKGSICLTFAYWYFGWSFLSWSLSSWVNFFESVLVSLPSVFLSMLPAILFFEVFLKGIFLRGLIPIKLQAAEAELWPASLQPELLSYTSQLETLGFVHLTDFTISTSKNKRPIARLFSHPQELCFAAVGVIGRLPMYCTISSHLENDWSLSVTDLKANNSNRPFSYAFFRHPKQLTKCVEEAPSSMLFRAFLNWRQQILQDLHLKPIQNIQVETYFNKEQDALTNVRRVLLRKSIIWGFIEMILFSHNPKKEWLGDYKKVDASY